MQQSSMILFEMIDLTKLYVFYCVDCCTRERDGKLFSGNVLCVRIVTKLHRDHIRESSANLFKIGDISQRLSDIVGGINPRLKCQDGCWQCTHFINPLLFKGTVQ